GSTCSTGPGADTVGVDHTYVSDLVFTLTSPKGTQSVLINQAGGSGINFCQTVLSDSGTLNIDFAPGAIQPFTGTFAPSSPLSVFRGEDPNGTWTLNVADNKRGDTGHVRDVSLTVQTYTCCPENKNADFSTVDIEPAGSANG